LGFDILDMFSASNLREWRSQSTHERKPAEQPDVDVADLPEILEGADDDSSPSSSASFTDYIAPWFGTLLPGVSEPWLLDDLALSNDIMLRFDGITMPEAQIPQVYQHCFPVSFPP
jgi:hypothetical protein